MLERMVFADDFYDLADELDGGRISKVREYLDSGHATEVLGPAC